MKECRYCGQTEMDLTEDKEIKDEKGYIVEILNSETEKKFNLKKIKYPSEFEIIKVNVKDFDLESFKL